MLVIDFRCSTHLPRTACRVPSMMFQFQRLLGYKQRMGSPMLTRLRCHYLSAGLSELIVVCRNVTEICFPNHPCLYLLLNAGSLMEKRCTFLNLLRFWHLVIYRVAHCPIHYPPGPSRVTLTPTAYFGCTIMTPSQKMIQKIYPTLLTVWTSTRTQTFTIHIQTKVHYFWETGTGTRGQ